MLARENTRLEHEDEAADSSEDLNDGGRKRIQEAARLEGISYGEALRRKRGFRYLL